MLQKIVNEVMTNGAGGAGGNDDSGNNPPDGSLSGGIRSAVYFGQSSSMVMTDKNNIGNNVALLASMPYYSTPKYKTVSNSYEYMYDSNRSFLIYLDMIYNASLNNEKVNIYDPIDNYRIHSAAVLFDECTRCLNSLATIPEYYNSGWFSDVEVHNAITKVYSSKDIPQEMDVNDVYLNPLSMAYIIDDPRRYANLYVLNKYAEEHYKIPCTKTEFVHIDNMLQIIESFCSNWHTSNYC